MYVCMYVCMYVLCTKRPLNKGHFEEKTNLAAFVLVEECLLLEIFNMYCITGNIDRKNIW